jgi:putative NADPH-quinone reductase
MMRLTAISAMLWPTHARMRREVLATWLYAGISGLDLPLLGSKKEFENGEVSFQLGNVAEELRSADHIVFVFPLWLGTMPALLKARLEQTLRPGIAFECLPDGRTTNLLSGKSARVIVTMRMPALMYRFWSLSHGVAGLRRSVLNFTGASLSGRPILASSNNRALRRGKNG